MVWLQFSSRERKSDHRRFSISVDPDIPVSETRVSYAIRRGNGVRNPCCYRDGVRQQSQSCGFLPCVLAFSHVQRIERERSRQAARNCAARARALDEAEATPQTRDIDKALTAAVSQWLSDRGHTHPSHIMSTASGVKDAAAAALVHLLIKHMSAAGFDLRNPITIARIWSRLGFEGESQKRSPL